MHSVEERGREFDPDDVHSWLLSLEVGLPLDKRWRVYQLDPVEELYQNVKGPNPLSKYKHIRTNHLLS